MANERARKLRSNQTDAERKLWQQLRHFKQDGFHFRRQVPIDHMIVDFACYSARLVIEVDGGQHNLDEGRRHDAARERHLAAQGFRVLRFWNNDVLSNTGGVIHVIRETLGLTDPHPQPLPARGRGAAPPRADGH